MERIPFDLQAFMNGDLAITHKGNEIKFLRRDGDEIQIDNISACFVKWVHVSTLETYLSMKPKEDSEWSEWIEHLGGECPIPQVKAGDYEIKTRDGEIYGTEMMANEWGSYWSTNSNQSIIAYRIKKHLLKPKEVKTIDRHVFEAPEEREVGACHYCETPIYLEYTRDKCVCEGCKENSSLISYPAPCTDDWTVCEYAPEEDLIIDPVLPSINKPYTPKDQYILNYVHEEPKGVLHEDEGMSRLITNLMRK